MALFSPFVALVLRRFAVFGSLILWLNLAGWAGTFTAYGPQIYVRDTGAPVTVTNTFTVLNPNTQYTLHLVNGGLVDAVDDLVSSTVITVNGVVIVAPNDLNQNISMVDKPVTLQASNTIDVQVRGAPGGKLSVEIIGVDNDPPVITADLSPAPNVTGWNKSDVTVNFSCSDAISGIAQCPSPVAISVEGANQPVSGQAVDKAGNTATVSVTVSLDKTPPSISASASPAPNTAGWNNTDVVVTFTCRDSLSGIASCPNPTTISAEGKNQIVTGVATDAAGNNAAAAASISLDKTPPVVTISSPPAGTTLNVASVTISGTVSDSGSGLSKVNCGGVPATVTGASFSCVQSLVAGTNNIQVQAVDAAGNAATASTAVAFVRPPQITITSPANSALFNQSPVTVTGTVADTGAQVTVNGISVPVTGNSFLATVPVQEGISTITAVATNTDGSTGTASVQVNLDTTPPHVAIYSPADEFVTTDTAVTVTGLVNDIVVGTVNPQQATVTVNGVAAQVANRSFSVSGIPLSPGSNTIHATAVDAAGNAATATVTVVRQVAGTPVVKVVSGNNQSGPIGTLLPQPLVAQVMNAFGQPVANVPVIFRVTAQDGTMGPDQPGVSDIAVNTDAQGQAQVQFRLGTHAGAGNNLVEASATGIAATAVFSASATSTGAALVNVDSGNNQFGVVGQALPLPFVAVVTDNGHNRIPNVPVTFTVKNGGGNINGQSSATLNSDGDGRVQAVLTLGADAGVNNNLVEVSFPGNAGFPAAFTATARTAGPAAATTISGVVLDNSNQPIPGVTMRLFQLNKGPSGNLPQPVGTPVQADGNGQFVISPAPVGVFKLMADGGTASRPGVWPTLEYDIITIPGQNNTVGSPIYLPQLNPNSKVCVTNTTGGTLTIPEVPGFALTIAPGSATFPGGSRTGCVTVTPVNMDKVPMVPGFGQQPRFVVTIQPVGTMFNPPAALTIPNVDGLAPRAVTEMYSYDHDLAAFVAIGSATVSDDGSVIKSDPGVGVLKAGWHCGGDPNTTGSAGTCPDCQKCQGSSCVADASLNNSTCKDDGNKCTDDICKDGACSHPKKNACSTCDTGQMCNKNAVCIPTQVKITAPQDGVTFNIDNSPAMPTINATADPSTDLDFQWQLTISDNEAGLSCQLSCSATTTTGSWTPDFSTCTGPSRILGGNAQLQLSACSSQDTKSFLIHGDNPTKATVQGAIGGDDTAKRIACWESGQQQFRNGVPFVGATNDVGIFQIVSGRTCADLWDWTANVTHGLQILAQKRAGAAGHQNSERQFNTALQQCQNRTFVPPPLSGTLNEGGVTQVEREAIRRYNAGREHAWQVTDLTTCAGSWVIAPSLTTNPGYVNNVLSRTATCP